MKFSYNKKKKERNNLIASEQSELCVTESKIGNCVCDIVG